ncbi:L-cystine transporter [Filobacillus milosensis]|uniref:L-cystine uptake protein TcyP n=1 Tax=Filobacillus milosensis TaxID=94137 RepID=A0A4Y8IMB4_9BACI|nr:L-cystine transporter [Filobacillus milosensis]TFB18926.1 L-cystine transporter [Filobacillus milosensis]
MLLILNIIIMLLLLTVLFQMQKKHITFSKRVFTGLGLGVLLGIFLQIAYGSDSNVVSSTTDWYSLVGSGYIRLLMMIVIPLVMVSIIKAITNLEKTSQLGKMSGWIIGILIGTSMIAAVIGVGTSVAFDLNADQIEAGQSEEDRGMYLEDRLGDVQNMSTPERILAFIPTNPFQDMTGDRATSTIAVVIFSAFIGIAVLGLRRKRPEQAEMFTKMIDAVYGVVMRIVTLILRLTPYGILGLMANTVARTDVGGIIELSKFVAASYVALLIMFVIHLLLISFSGLNPLTYLKKVLPVLGFAFTSRSSAGTIPLNIQTQKNNLGVPDGVADMSASFGATIGQNGCAGVYPAMLAVMIAPTVGINPLEPSFLLMLVLIIGISSFGVAGVGGGATFAALIVLSAMDLPVYLAGLLISIEPLIDMGRTALNVNGAMTSGTITSRVLGTHNKDRFNDPSANQIDMSEVS